MLGVGRMNNIVSNWGGLKERSLGFRFAFPSVLSHSRVKIKWSSTVPNAKSSTILVLN